MNDKTDKRLSILEHIVLDIPEIKKSIAGIDRKINIISIIQHRIETSESKLNCKADATDLKNLRNDFESHRKQTQKIVSWLTLSVLGSVLTAVINTVVR